MSTDYCRPVEYENWLTVGELIEALQNIDEPDMPVGRMNDDFRFESFSYPTGLFSITKITKEGYAVRRDNPDNEHVVRVLTLMGS